MQTSPGSYAVEAVNQALDTLPVNQVSPVLEGPTSYHIVLVENRRAAGPATFKEIQDEMRTQGHVSENAQGQRCLHRPVEAGCPDLDDL